MHIRVDLRRGGALGTIALSAALGVVLDQRAWAFFTAGMVIQLVGLLVATRLQRSWPLSTPALARLSQELLRSLPRHHELTEASALVRRLSAALGEVDVTLVLLDEHDQLFREQATTRPGGDPIIIARNHLEACAKSLARGYWFELPVLSERSPLGRALGAANIASILPINVEGRTSALFLFGPAKRPLNHIGRELLEDVGREVGALLENVMLRELASIDPLTELPRRHVADQRIVHEIERALRSETSFALIMVDLDHFKAINDELGHAAGDIVLRRVAQILVQESRSIDLVSRWGGEEFMIVLPETDHAGGSAAAEKLRESIERAEIIVAERPLRVTASLGVAEVNASIDAEPVAAIERVDRALYLAKRGGRNRVEGDVPALVTSRAS